MRSIHHCCKNRSYLLRMLHPRPPTVCYGQLMKYRTLCRVFELFCTFFFFCICQVAIRARRLSNKQPSAQRERQERIPNKAQNVSARTASTCDGERKTSQTNAVINDSRCVVAVHTNARVNTPMRLFSEPDATKHTTHQTK